MDQDPGAIRRRRAPSSRLLLVLTLACVALFAATVGPRPAGAAWDRLFDVGLYNAPYLAASATCWLAARRVPRERTAWRALTAGLLMSALANALASGRAHGWTAPSARSG